MQAKSTVEESHALPKLKRVISLEDQTAVFSQKRRIICFLGLAFALFLSFLDSTSVALAQPQIAADLQAGRSISWIGTAYLIANTSCQLVYARFSDILGRKVLLLVALGIFAVGDLACAFAQTPIQLFAFRAIAGIGGGGINNLAMVIMSDITTLRERGKWQGFIGVAVAAGNTAGPFLGALLTQYYTWRAVFWIPVPCTVVCAALIWRTLPLKPVSGSMKSKLVKIDYAGTILSLGANVLILFAISSGGAEYAWTSAIILSTLLVGIALAAAFLVVEWKFAALPVMPLRLFTYRTPCLLLWSFCLQGAVYYANIYWLPIYFISLRRLDPVTSAAIMLALLIPQSIMSALMGIVTSKTGIIKPIIVGGCLLWTIGSGLEIMFERLTPLAGVIVILLIQGIAFGSVSQSGLVAAQATAPAQDRAVITGARNFLRTGGGSLGLAIGNAILNGVVTKELPTDLPNGLREEILAEASLDLPAGLPDYQRQGVFDAYQSGLRYIFVFFLPLMVISLFMSFFIENINLQKPAATQPTEKSETAGESSAVEVDEKGSPGESTITAVDIEAGGEVASEPSQRHNTRAL